MNPRVMSRKKKILWLLVLVGGFGLLPVWMSLAWVQYKVAQYNTRYDAAYGWYVVGGVYASIITLSIALVTAGTFRNAAGDDQERFRKAVDRFLRSFVVLLVLVGASCVYQGLR
jgi:hypothetical protein